MRFYKKVYYWSYWYFIVYLYKFSKFPCTFTVACYCLLLGLCMRFCASKCNEQERSWALSSFVWVLSGVWALSLLSLGIISGCLLSVCPTKQHVHSHMPLPYISIYAGCAFMCVLELLHVGVRSINLNPSIPYYPPAYKSITYFPYGLLH